MSEQESRQTNREGSFDELAKGLAVGTALVGGALAAIPGVAWAAKSAGEKGCRTPGQTRVQGQCRCPEETTPIGNACCPNEEACGTRCGCPAGEHCCVIGGTPTCTSITCVIDPEPN